MNEDPPEGVTPTSVIEDLISLDHVFDDTQRKRKEIIDLLGPVIKEQKFVTENARQTEVQVQLIKIYTDLLTTSETSISRRINTKLKQTEVTQSGNHSAAVVDLLSRIDATNIKLGDASQIIDNTDEQLERVFSENGLDPVRDTELLTDHKDVTI